VNDLAQMRKKQSAQGAPLFYGLAGALVMFPSWDQADYSLLINILKLVIHSEPSTFSSQSLKWKPALEQTLARYQNQNI